MYNPCVECWIRYDKQYSEECDSKCDYAYQLSKLKPYGGIDEALKVMKGDSFPLVLIDAEHIDHTYRMVCAAKDGVI